MQPVLPDWQECQVEPAAAAFLPQALCGRRWLGRSAAAPLSTFFALLSIEVPVDAPLLKGGCFTFRKRAQRPCPPQHLPHTPQHCALYCIPLTDLYNSVMQEVPVDAALLKGGVAAFGMGTAPLPPTGSSSALSPTLQQAAPTSSASAKGTTTGSSAQLSTLHSMGPNGQQPNGGAAREHGCQHLPQVMLNGEVVFWWSSDDGEWGGCVQASRLPGERRMAPSPLLTSSQSLSYSAAHVDGAAGAHKGTCRFYRGSERPKEARARLFLPNAGPPLPELNNGWSD
eukprot:1137474-Pelagomonas_calceolata.AAC.6